MPSSRSPSLDPEDDGALPARHTRLGDVQQDIDMVSAVSENASFPPPSVSSRPGSSQGSQRQSQPSEQRQEHPPLPAEEPMRVDLEVEQPDVGVAGPMQEQLQQAQRRDPDDSDSDSLGDPVLAEGEDAQSIAALEAAALEEDSATCMWGECGIVFTHLPSLIQHIHNGEFSLFSPTFEPLGNSQ
jgi:hypothetical protein